jgi:hypothetical protein
VNAVALIYSFVIYCGVPLGLQKATWKYQLIQLRAYPARREDPQDVENYPPP